MATIGQAMFVGMDVIVRCDDNWTCCQREQAQKKVENLHGACPCQIKTRKVSSTPPDWFHAPRFRGDGFSFDTWARQRAAVANVCFEVYQAGVTDWDNPDIWRELDVKVFYSYNSEAFLNQYVNMVYRAGNNARYAIDLRPLDPFASYTCPPGPVTTVYQGSEPYVQSEFEFLVTVNGQEIRPAGPGSTFRGIFTDYANNPWRQENCN